MNQSRICNRRSNSLRRTHKDIDWKIGWASHVNFGCLLMRCFPVRSHDHKKIDIRIRCRVTARMRPKEDDPLRVERACDGAGE
jgi:hypothetical protein